MKFIFRFVWKLFLGRKTYMFNYSCISILAFLFLVKEIPLWLLILGCIYCGNKVIERMTAEMQERHQDVLKRI